MTKGFSDPAHPIWALASRLVNIIPAFMVLYAITGTWDGEIGVLLAILGGREISGGIDRLRTKNSEITDSDT